ncbi:outer membrane receptor protein involved in Fe transport [Leeuwenhoekiella aestuarii]|uniref:Outer membrane receptor protein involved in Fe transport n=1 Tax=Leeuwenhoekiella aestuarii TaxID=2249426 RepID=A0A4Q0P0I0_9FLAO|nr:TonB-dependent receptor plug domain-containing protein [Leeuwenhoekiella aestuarii]RXG18288.1 outer membrane receptor protein involved in Fe transport [Leeuwenhoekiella aestuarii]RXG19593.1 outer membrane receptor protein involved in Fe transport [Leeuwenhoekiella aestuarii]
MKYIFILLLVCCASVNAQDLTGTITDRDKHALENVNIYNLSKGSHTHTDANGTFVLPAPWLQDSLVISRLGFKTQHLIVDQALLSEPLVVELEEASTSLDQVVLTAEVNSLSTVVAVDLKLNPVKSSQEILRKVPGLFIGQHAGGGKAEQIFLRGFDIDHGTDVAISVDGMPVNMVSHAHGQGYADLHFVIPETIENIDFGKGAYYADKGNFNTAGYVDLRLKEHLDASSISVEAGQFNTSRLTGLFNLVDEQNHTAYLASEMYLTDGPFDSPQNFNRFNVLGKYTYTNPNKDKLTLTASHFQSKWDASGQIPQRAVDQGLIGRFGAIDDTEGGQTSRTNINLNHLKNLEHNAVLKTNAFVSKYDFELYSNFTFFLEDPVNGDQIKQQEDRFIAGLQSVYERKHVTLGSGSLEYQAGVGFRYDNVDHMSLSHTLNRQTTLDRIALGDVDELNAFAFLNTEFKTGKFTFNPAVRLDYFKFDYYNKLTETYDNQSESKVAFSPKFNTIFSPTQNWQLSLKTGIGFHSNDTRVVVANSGEDILPAAYSVDLGTIVKPIDRLALNATLWTLFLDQEFVYVGDAGIVEPSGKSRRMGVEVGARYQLLDWLYVYGDANYTHARSTEEADGEDYIPLAPKFTSAGGLSVDNRNGFSGTLGYRWLGDRAANEDNSIVAAGYFVTDFNVNYTIKNWTLGIIVENLFDVDWNETQFATESRLFNEPAPVEEIHFTPGTPFYLRGKITYRF